MAQVFPVPAAIRDRATKLLATIGNTPLMRLEAIAADVPGHRDLRQGRVLQPRRIGEGPRRRST